MLLTFAVYLLAAPSSAYAAGRFATVEKMDEPYIWAIAGAFLPPMGAVLAIIMLSKGLRK